MAEQCPRCAAPTPPDAPAELCPRCLVARMLLPAAPAPPEPVSTRFGDYELHTELARGGMGVVWRARQRSLDREVALKMILSGHFASEAEVLRFHAEARAAASLDHPNIIPIYEVGECEGRQFFTMKLAEGGSLAAGNRSNPAKPGRATPGAAAALLVKVARAVHHAHQRGILHRDLKPHNILLDAEGEPMVADFGLAKQGARDAELTVSGTVLGSPNYMAPEQAEGRTRLLTTTTDVYGLGAILYYLLTGRPPFEGRSPLEILHKVVNEDPLPPSKVGAGGAGNGAGGRAAPDADLETICLKCLEKEPARRYRGADELADDLERWLRDEPIRARQTGRLERARKWARRRPALAGLVGVSIAAAFVVVGILWDSHRKVRHERDVVKDQQRVTAENLYAADLFLGYQALEAGNLARARAALEAQRPRPGQPDLRGFEWRWLRGQTRGDDVAMLAGQGAEANCVAFSPDGSLLAQGGWRGPALLWRWRAGEFLGPVPAPGVAQTRMQGDLAAIMAAQPMLLSKVLQAGESPSSLDRKIRPTGSGYVTSMSFSSDGEWLATGETDRFAKLWRWREQRLLGVIPEVGCRVAFVPWTNWVVVGIDPAIDGARARRVRCYAPGNPAPVLSFPEANGHFALAADGRRLALAPPGGPARLHRLPDKSVEQVFEFRGHAAGLALSPDGKRLAVMHGDAPRIELFDTGTGERTGELALRSAGAARFERMAFAPDSRKLATSGADHALRVWDVEARRELAVLRGHEAEVRDVAFTPDGRWIVTASKDKTVRFWTAAPPESRPESLPLHDALLTSADGRMLLGRDANSRWHAWDAVRQSDPPASFSLRPQDVPLALLDAGRTVVCARHEARDAPGELVWFDAGAATEQRRTTLPREDLRPAAALSPDARTVAWARMHGMISTFDTANGRRLHTTTWKGAVEATALAFSPDGGHLLAVAAPDQVRLHAAADLRPRWALTDTPAVCWAFSVDGRNLALGRADNLVTVHDAGSGARVASFAGHKEQVLQVAFTRDGRTLASAGADGEIKLWHLRTGRELGAWRDAPDCGFLRFLANDDALCVGRRGGDLRVLRVPTLTEADQPVSSPGFPAALFQSTTIPNPP